MIVKQETTQLSSQYMDRTLMYPGKWVLTWMRTAWGWLLIGMAPAE